MSVVDVGVALQRFMYLDNLISFYDDDDEVNHADECYNFLILSRIQQFFPKRTQNIINLIYYFYIQINHERHFGFANLSALPSYRGAAAWELNFLRSCFPANNDSIVPGFNP